jgi:hypothetical protein
MKPKASKNKLTNFIMFVLTSLAYLLYYIFFFGATYFFFDAAQKMYHIWIVSNILIGLFGATLFVYPLKIVKFGTYGLIFRYLFYLWLIFVLYGISLLASELYGLGTIKIH